MKEVLIDNIYIDKEAKDNKITKDILKKHPNIPNEVISENEIKYFYRDTELVDKSKKTLFLTINKGKFLKKCPGTKSHLCCNYYVLTPVYNCPLDCSYCFLQGHINSSYIKMFVNYEDIFKELDKLIELYPNMQFRLGTGEFSDSLVFEDINNFAESMFKYIEERKNIIFELKTKTNNIEMLLKQKPLENVVIAWSVNPEKLISCEEIGTAALNERIEAAYKCQEYGYKVAFHFDPIINYLGWEEDYKQLINMIFKNIYPKNISWISLGTLRYTQETKKVIEKRFPESKIIYGELIQGLDGKYRYFKKIREEMFKKIYDYLKSRDNNLLIYMCMEADFMWRKIFGSVPNCTDVKSLFDNRI